MFNVADMMERSRGQVVREFRYLMTSRHEYSGVSASRCPEWIAYLERVFDRIDAPAEMKVELAWQGLRDHALDIATRKNYPGTEEGWIAWKSDFSGYFANLWTRRNNESQVWWQKCRDWKRLDHETLIQYLRRFECEIRSGSPEDVVLTPDDGVPVLLLCRGLPQYLIDLIAELPGKAEVDVALVAVREEMRQREILSICVNNEAANVMAGDGVIEEEEIPGERDIEMNPVANLGENAAVNSEDDPTTDPGHGTDSEEDPDEDLGEDDNL